MPTHPKEHHTHKHTNAQTLIPVLSLPLRRLSRLAARYEEQQQHWVKWREGKGGKGGEGREEKCHHIATRVPLLNTNTVAAAGDG